MECMIDKLHHVKCAELGHFDVEDLREFESRLSLHLQSDDVSGTRTLATGRAEGRGAGYGGADGAAARREGERGAQGKERGSGEGM